MKYYLLVNKGLEAIAVQELKELCNLDSTSSVGVVEFEADKKQIEKILKHCQSARRILAALGKYSSVDNIPFPEFPWNEYYSQEKSTKVEVEGVKGQDNRIEISKNVGTQIFGKLKNPPKVELKNPDMITVVFFNNDYFIGVDLIGQLNTRFYRVFAHAASFKGDLAYFFVRKSLFKKGEQLLVGFMKDGTMAIEAELMASGQVVTGQPTKAIESTVHAFDEGMQNVTAARKNAKIAKVNIHIHKYSLDELDVKYDKESIDRSIFYITTKDEDRINELYYQLNYVLKSKGTALLIGRVNWELSISSKFNLLEEGTIMKGESTHKFWLLEKK